jgi:hypothetical protein
MAKACARLCELRPAHIALYLPVGTRGSSSQLVPLYVSVRNLFLELEPPIGIHTDDPRITSDTLPGRTRTGCTNSTGNRSQGTRRAGTIHGPVPRTVPRPRGGLTPARPCCGRSGPTVMMLSADGKPPAGSPSRAGPRRERSAAASHRAASAVLMGWRGRVQGWQERERRVMGLHLR